jgi:hypothetical protein
MICLRQEDNLLPSIPHRQLMDLIVFKLIAANETLNFIAEIPITTKNYFTEFFVVPTPIQDMIPDFEPKLIIVDTLVQLYVDSISSIQINETVSISTNPVIIRNKLTNGTDCVIKTVIQHENYCPLKVLTRPTDLWIETPIPNVIAFISTVAKIERCSSSLTKIKRTAGFIKMTPNCRIETPNYVIISPLDKTSHAFKYFKIVAPENFSENTSVSYVPDTPLATLPPIDDSSLQDTRIETESIINHKWDSHTIIVIATTTIISSIIIITSFVLLFHQFCKSPIINEAVQSEPEQVTKTEPIYASPQPTPSNTFQTSNGTTTKFYP